MELQAPDALRPLIEQHVRLLKRSDVVVPEHGGERAALSRRARREVASLLATEGYFNPDISFDRSDANRWVLVVKPGERATVSNVSLSFSGHLGEGGEGDGRAARRNALRDAWRLKTGQPFRQAEWDAAKAEVLDSVSSRSYAAARISASRAEVDPETAGVALSVTIDSGPPFFLGPLTVSGLERLPATLVPRYAELEEGEDFDQERLLAFQSALQSAPQFSSVIVEIDRDPALASAVPVKVEIVEANSRFISMGAGYSTNTGARAEINWRDVNLFRRGWELSTGLRLEQLQQSMYADVFLPPSSKGYRDSAGILFETSDIEGLKSTNQAIGITRTEARGNIETTLNFRYQHESTEIGGNPSTSSNALTASWAWTQRKVNDVLDPRRGYVLRAELGGGSKALLSDQDFVRLYGRVAWYLPVGETDIVTLRGETGLTVAPSRDGIPQDYLFRTGGAQTVRGYPFEGLGVQDGDTIVGGRYLATASAEYVRWFLPQWGAAAFIDAGDAADSRSEFDVRLGYGLGARWRSPAGPLALDLAYGQSDQRLRIHFSVAIAF